MTENWNNFFAHRTSNMKSSAIRDLLKVTEQAGVISFGGGLPSPDSFPLPCFAEACSRVLRKLGTAALQYGKTEGYTPLREHIAYKAFQNGIPATAENVLITTGSQQALDLLGKILIDPGDRVVVEAPTYIGALQAWNAYGAGYLTVPMDENGMDIGRLETLLKLRPKFIYLLPNFQNPSGITMSLERRLGLIQLARRYTVPIIEDDPYGNLRYEGADLPSVLRLDGGLCGKAPATGNVIYLSTFSKILSPGVRLGWVIAPQPVIAKLAIAKQGTDLHTSTFVQMVAHEISQEDFLAEHIKLVRRLYRERRDAMLSALQRAFPPGASWTHRQGGLFLWSKLPPGIDTVELLVTAVKQKVAFVPGTPFYPDGRGRREIRLNFSFSSPDSIHEGIDRLGQLLNEYTTGREEVRHAFAHHNGVDKLGA